MDIDEHISEAKIMVYYNKKLDIMRGNNKHNTYENDFKKQLDIIKFEEFCKKIDLGG